MTPRVISSANEFRQACESIRRHGHRLGLVPTMGALHQGHSALMLRAKALTDCVAVTIFVNPTQFGPNEDLVRYPRTRERDVECCQEAGVSLIFTPSVQEMYPAGERTRVVVSSLTQGLCGAIRPGHFDGVATIVAKLFVLSGACVAVFGKKDYQQLKVIERMVKDLLLPISVEGHPIVREPDGVARSSRNAYLSAAERVSAVGIVRGLSLAYREFKAGERGVDRLIQCVKSELEAHSLAAQYVTLADPESLQACSSGTQCPERALLAVAAHCGNTRLIDNVVLGEDSEPSA